LTGNELFLEKAKATLRGLFQVYRDFNIRASSYALAVELYLHPIQVHIVGSRKNVLTQEYVHEALGVYNPLMTIEVLGPATDTERLKTLKYPVGEKPAAYVCAEGKCTLAENAANLVKLVG
jgi:uncharacterized protein YyaL (SSP411 family)